MRPLGRRLSDAPFELPVALAALAVLTLTDSWRLALLVAFAGAAICATRLRYASTAAAALTVTVAALAVAIGPLGDDQRPAPERTGAAATSRR